MVIAQGDVWWADLPAPRGAGPGFRRPVIVIQSDSINRSRIETVLVVPLTSNLKWIDAPGNILLDAAATRLPKDSVAPTTQTLAIDRSALTDHVGKLSAEHLAKILDALELVVGR